MKNSAVVSKPPATGLKGHLVSRARGYILSVLEKGIKHGQLQIVEGNDVRVFGETKLDHTQTPGIIYVDDPAVWLRIIMTNDLGFAEAFMLGEVRVNDLKAICDIWLTNVTHLAGLSTVLHQLFSKVFQFTSNFFGQNLGRARLNAVAGYDASNTMFQAFLSKEMMYSCALWSDKQGGVNGDLKEKYVDDGFDLEAAQKAKIDYVLDKLHIKAGDRVLEVGSGWCGLAIQAVTRFGCTIDTLTLSAEQKKLGEARIKAAGLGNSITVHLLDYRCLPPSFEKAFDAFVSIEMIEHVGTRHYEKYFQVVDWALKEKRGMAVVTSSTIAESRYSTYQEPDFSRYYMWPNGALPSATALVQAANGGSQGRLILETVENHGKHYPRTLREWKRRFESNMPAVQQEIIDEKPELADPALFEPFKRKWLYLFPYAEAGFDCGYLSCHMLTFGRDV
ncbi:cyclopropane-fatty-acyl-phospholipid synthase [Roridomyces roridus]|uniref:Cyclopropane-fatty-acyl-phospholipid synthase n=1 Tax=Roridomyces roridus TaxID=1738132 RepID=A0AAD7FKS5_9AGAR|nr:cyclopropane-fatty-acyl-phospholipid synthase [Roridomyces roridus]